MPTRLIQLESHPSGTAALHITGPAVERLPADEDLEISILQPGQQDSYLDPRNPDHAWSTAVFRFRPLHRRREGAALLLDIDYGVTYHLRANQPYKLKIRRPDGIEVEERFTGSANLRRPTSMPQGWTPPPDPRGPIAVPPPAAAPEAGASPVPIIEAAPDVPTGPAAHEPLPEVERAPEPEPEPEQGRTGTVRSDDDAAGPQISEPHIKGQRTKWIALASVGALLIAVVAAWWMWSDREAPAPTAEAQSDESLEGVRRYIASNPEPAAARAKAESLAANGKLLDAQFLLIKYAAERGDPTAARMMGAFYDPHTWSQEKSPLPAPNPLEAARWHKMAAEAGDAESQYRYGMLLKKGGTDEPNGPEMAVAWLRKAAEQGNADAKKALEE